MADLTPAPDRADCPHCDAHFPAELINDVARADGRRVAVYLCSCCAHTFEIVEAAA